MALDQRKLGENNHHEHTWSESSFEEHFSQFYFQLVRTKDMSNLEERFTTLIETSKGNLDNLILLAKMTLIIFSIILCLPFVALWAGFGTFLRNFFTSPESSLMLNRVMGFSLFIVAVWLLV